MTERREGMGNGKERGERERVIEGVGRRRRERERDFPSPEDKNVRHIVQCNNKSGPVTFHWEKEKEREILKLLLPTFQHNS